MLFLCPPRQQVKSFLFQLMFDIDTLGSSGGSGLLNSDSHILKVVGYKMDGEQPSKKTTRSFPNIFSNRLKEKREKI